MSSGRTLLVPKIPSGSAADYTGDGIDEIRVGIPQQSFLGFTYPGAVG